MAQNIELTPREQGVIEGNSDLVKTKAAYYLANIARMTPRKASNLAKKHVALELIRKTEPLYGHDEESLMDLYHELKAIEDAETGADREYGYDGTDELDRTPEEIKDYVLKYNMY